jgi:MFS transporter, putative metabolite:H+ symporter
MSQATLALSAAMAKPVTTPATVTELGISARIERLPFSRWHFRVLSAVGLCHFFDAFDALTIAFVVPVLVSQWHIGAPEIGLLISAGYVGQMIGAIGLGAFAEKAGRVPIIRWALVFIGLLSLACAFAGNLQVLIALRLVQGIGLGAEIPIGASYINEVCPARIRGRAVFVLQATFALSTSVTAIVAAAIVPAFGWQSMFIVGALPLIVALVFARIVPESPRWLANRGRLAEADAIVGEMEASASKGGTIPLSVPVEQSLPIRHSAKFSDLFSSELRSRTFGAWVIGFCLSFTGYGLLVWMPTLYRTVYHLPIETALKYGIVQNVASVTGAIVGLLIIDFLGRRLTFLVGFLGAAAPLFYLWTVGISVDVSVVLTCSATAMLFISILLAGIYVYLPEIYPTRMRALGAGIGSAWLRIASICGPLIVAMLLTQASITAVFLAFAGASVVGAIAVLTSVVETRGKRLEEIAQ